MILTGYIRVVSSDHSENRPVRHDLERDRRLKIGSIIFLFSFLVNF